MGPSSSSGQLRSNQQSQRPAIVTVVNQQTPSSSSGQQRNNQAQGYDSTTSPSQGGSAVLSNTVGPNNAHTSNSVHGGSATLSNSVGPNNPQTGGSNANSTPSQQNNNYDNASTGAPREGNSGNIPRRTRLLIHTGQLLSRKTD